MMGLLSTDPVLGLAAAAVLFVALGLVARRSIANAIRKDGDHPLADLVAQAGRGFVGVGVLAVLVDALIVVVGLAIQSARGIIGGAP